MRNKQSERTTGMVLQKPSVFTTSQYAAAASSTVISV